MSVQAIHILLRRLVRALGLDRAPPSVRNAQRRRRSVRVAQLHRSMEPA